MTQAQKGDHVRVHYKGKFDDGTEFDNSLEGEPLDFIIGEAQLMPGFQTAVVGMNQGDSKSFTLTADEAYGPYHEQLIQEVDRAGLPPDLQVEVGTRLNANDGQGNTIPVTVTEVTDNTVTIDANHPLAGENLTFEITLVEIL